ncbi:TetR/AcrR family transcriptional regulator [Arthrobacter sp. NEB 688]|uniref:TetR/AcrR family transcriptional regulator n=1 Tax=Arthrobacter sp. NEB 688 TaxID=904039 RepID=UPI0015644222|nr:TetR/AcrR family transcriptional regulator [Arthrobacter sp. NEB 688]QKE83193.1 TetR/AcrR family transcriptional regulator [Arthrobacter sp. NEB 688]
MPPTSRADRRRETEARIVEVGRRHLASEGAAGLSLRAVTRELGMVSSAVYRYVAHRDELLTLLVVDAYTELADTVDAAVAAAADRPWDERVVVAGTAFRAWAVGEPARYALLYGSPVPGYEAPPERTVEPGTRVTLLVLRLLAEGVAAGDVPPTGAVPVPRTDAGSEAPSQSEPGTVPDATLSDDRGTGTIPSVAGTGLVDDLRRLGDETGLVGDLRRLGDETGLPGGPDVMGRALLLWSVLLGATSLEVFGQYGRDTLTDPAALLQHQLRLTLALLRTPA